MSSSCPYAHVSYATWRLRVLRQLCAGAETVSNLRLQFLNRPNSTTASTGRRAFHESSPRVRGKIQDAKRSARHRAVQLELEKYVKHGVEAAGTVFARNTYPVSNTSAASKQKLTEWNPYQEDSLSDLQDLVGNLRNMAMQATKQDKEEDEGVPFELGSRILARKDPQQSLSPLERRLPWERDKKLQRHEVEVDRRLEQNVWAQILASPLRADRGTKSRLPRELSVTWGIMLNPETGKDYLLPVDVSDLDALRAELGNDVTSSETESSSGEVQSEEGKYFHKATPGPRIPIQPNKLLLQAMKEHFMHVRRAGGQESFRTSKGKIGQNLIPYRWRHKQAELTAFQRTRERFNEALNRTPDEDEPDMKQMANIAYLEWQHDIADRLEKIMRERILIVLDAVGAGNKSNRAIHERRVFALPVPGDGHFHLDAHGRLIDTQPSPLADTVNQESHPPQANNNEPPDWIHGAIFLHIGPPEHYRTIIERWHQYEQSQSSHQKDNLTPLPSSRFIPPTITIDNKFRLPLFNLEALFGQQHASRVQNVVASHHVLTLDFWQRKTGATEESGSKAHTGFRVDTEPRTKLDLGSPVPDSTIAAGAQVLSSILSPGASTSPGSTWGSATPPTSSSPDSPATISPTSSSPSSSPSTPASESQSQSQSQSEPYLILIRAHSKHASILIREIWQMWRYVGGRDGMKF